MFKKSRNIENIINKDSGKQKSPKEEKSRLQKLRDRFVKFNSKDPQESLKKFSEASEEESLYDSRSYISTESSISLSETPERLKGKDASDVLREKYNIERMSEGSNFPKAKEIVIERFEPGPLMVRDARVASVRNFKDLAHNLLHAFEQKKSPERVYRVLYFLLLEREAINKFENAFEKKGGRNLEDSLRAHFGEDTPQLKYALFLIGRDDTGVNQTLDQIPQTKEECLNLSQHIHNALLHRNFEAIYRALTPFQRNTELLCRFNDGYKIYKQSLNTGDTVGLQADMKRYLVTDALKFGLFLIGDDAMATRVVKLAEAERLAKVSLDQTFDLEGDGKRVPVPHEYTWEGCMHRAHILAQAFKELGYGVEKIFVHCTRTRHGVIRGGMVDPDGSGNIWTYHTACWIWVRTGPGKKERRILAPSGNRANPKILWTLGEWLEWQGQDPASVKYITFEKWQRKVEQQHKKHPRALESSLETYPANKTYVFTTSRNYVGIPNAISIQRALQFNDIPDQYSRTLYNREGKKMMESIITLMPFWQAKNDMRQEIQEPTINDDPSAIGFLNDMVEKFEASLRGFDFEEPITQFSSVFLNDYNRFIAHLTERVSPETVARFKMCLSEESLK